MKGKHLTLEDRIKIQEGIENGKSKVDIAKTIGKDPTTIGKEIKARRTFKQRNIFNRLTICTHYKECKTCYEKCDNYEEIKCLRRDRKVGACNLCPNIKKCRLDKYFYRATKAHNDYLYTLSDSRQGVNLTSKEMIEIVHIIKPLLKKGQSLYQIVENHPEINLSVRTLYTYIECGIFKDYGIDNFSLRRKVSMKKRKSLKKRKEPANYTGRKYEDYLEFVKQHPNLITVEMDTVYNNTNGPYIQTFMFPNIELMIGFLHKERTAEAMSSTLDCLQDFLGNDYYKLFSLILTDRGTEFEKYKLFEINMETGEFRSNIFYCDPQKPSQKPHVENNHTNVRKIIPKKISIKDLTQEDINLMFSHINSVPRESLGGKTPYEAFCFFYGEDILKKLNIQKIEKDTVTLQPYLLNLKK